MSFLKRKQRPSQQTVIFIVFTAELLQYSTESHEIKLILKTRTTKKKTTTKTVVWLLLQVHFHELKYRDPLPIFHLAHDFWLLPVRQNDLVC